MTTRLPPHALNLKKFLLRQQVIKLYRDAFKVIRTVEETNQKAELTLWTREEFKRNKMQTDEAAIKMLIMQGRQTLNEMQQAVNMAK
ncbi:LYR motif-containing protein 2-like [Apostichopus japonicus]|uniref:LYR motif-containing protein 2-like n=1 Tax=Stichopus japonicus TaxID=307972 RepID=UPI003AB30A14